MVCGECVRGLEWVVRHLVSILLRFDRNDLYQKEAVPPLNRRLHSRSDLVIERLVLLPRTIENVLMFDSVFLCGWLILSSPGGLQRLSVLVS
jgi:hypothetical protein